MRKQRTTVRLIALAGLLLLATLSPAAASTTCDTSAGSADAIQLEAAHHAIDAACPCDSFADRGEYRRCAKAAIDDMVANSSLTALCKRPARDYAWLSRCGTPGAVVCCRVDSTGRPKHRVVRDATKCVSSSSFQQCLAETKSIVTGCDDSGCIAWCGNGIVDAEEDCEPPGSDTCDSTCHTSGTCGDGVLSANETCEPPGTATCDLGCQACPTQPSGNCGNLVVDPGEDCEPPGAASCDRTCHTAGCPAAGPGEIDVACVDGNTEVAAAASSSGYLLAWSGQFRAATTDILARRFDAGGLPVDPSVRIVSAEQTCGTESSSPSAGSDGSDYYVLWAGVASFPQAIGIFQESLSGRRLGGDGNAQATDTIATFIPFGTCRSSLGGPTATAGAGAARFAISWRTSASCYGNPMFIDPQGSFLEYAPDLVTTAAPIGYPLPSGYPITASVGVATVASLSGATLWSWHAGGAASPDGPFLSFVAAQWSDGSTTTSPFALSSRQAIPSSARPSVSAGSSSFLVTWADGVTSDPATDVRAVRVTRGAGRLDADGGLLLATVPAGVVATPVASFDGTHWLVAWTQKSGVTYEIRAVAVRTDGTVVDASPRLVASDVLPRAPVLASSGNGKVLVAFTRQGGGLSAVRGVIVTP